ncbi:hypothetical protein JOC75_002390 [Metabacillus crassostreae]|uniref:YpoC family protein n=1 Tax=Metabacillus crassostreae TaxID=929098 RepID=UPI00195E6695|nr:hypothetical protein [Metabacillus crassostreae]MBM7604387.1 hypothetical protein [Metabacillus crassostreae]
MPNKLQKIPAAFLFPPFDKNCGGFITFNETTQLVEVLQREPFYYDILFNINQASSYKPWKTPTFVLQEIFELQHSLMNQIKEGFRSRKPNKDLLIKLLSLFIISLFWLNKQPVKSLDIKGMEIDKLLRKPVNCEERLTFILKKPTQYHAFIQLEQLFIELEKIYAKAVVLKQLS